MRQNIEIVQITVLDFRSLSPYGRPNTETLYLVYYHFGFLSLRSYHRPSTETPKIANLFFLSLRAYDYHMVRSSCKETPELVHDVGCKAV